jgi:hypothetical protein
MRLSELSLAMLCRQIAKQNSEMCLSNARLPELHGFLGPLYKVQAARLRDFLTWRANGNAEILAIHKTWESLA